MITLSGSFRWIRFNRLFCRLRSRIAKVLLLSHHNFKRRWVGAQHWKQVERDAMREMMGFECIIRVRFDFFYTLTETRTKSTSSSNRVWDKLRPALKENFDSIEFTQLLYSVSRKLTLILKELLLLLLVFI